MKKFVFIFLIVFTVFLLASPALSQTNQLTNQTGYKLMVNIPGAGKIEDFSDYIKYLYLFGLAIVGVVAMLFIIIGGIRYMTAAGNQTAISEAKSQITAAILGLVLVLTSWLILNTINPELVSLKKIKPPKIEEWKGGAYWICKSGSGPDAQVYTACLSKENCEGQCGVIMGTRCYYQPWYCERPRESHLKCDENRNICVREFKKGHDDSRCVGKSEGMKCEEEAPPIYYTCKNLKCVKTDDPELAEPMCGNEIGRGCIGWHLECINNKCVGKGTGHTTKPDEDGCKRTEGKYEGAPCP